MWTIGVVNPQVAGVSAPGVRCAWGAESMGHIFSWKVARAKKNDSPLKGNMLDNSETAVVCRRVTVELWTGPC